MLHGVQKKVGFPESQAGALAPTPEVSCAVVSCPAWLTAVAQDRSKSGVLSDLTLTVYLTVCAGKKKTGPLGSSSVPSGVAVDFGLKPHACNWRACSPPAHTPRSREKGGDPLERTRHVGCF